MAKVRFVRRMQEVAAYKCLSGNLKVEGLSHFRKGNRAIELQVWRPWLASNITGDEQRELNRDAWLRAQEGHLAGSQAKLNTILYHCQALCFIVFLLISSPVIPVRYSREFIPT